jgi:hypothetical protein
MATIVERLRFDARVAGRERVRSKHACGAHDRNAKRRAGSGGMAADQIELQLGGVLRRNHDIGEPSEAGRHAIDWLSSSEVSLHKITGTCDALAGCRRNDYRGSEGHRLDRFKREMVAVYFDWGRLRHRDLRASTNRRAPVSRKAGRFG